MPKYFVFMSKYEPTLNDFCPDNAIFIFSLRHFKLLHKNALEHTKCDYKISCFLYIGIYYYIKEEVNLSISLIIATN